MARNYSENPESSKICLLALRIGIVYGHSPPRYRITEIVKLIIPKILNGSRRVQPFITQAIRCGNIEVFQLIGGQYHVFDLIDAIKLDQPIFEWILKSRFWTKKNKQQAYNTALRNNRVDIVCLLPEFHNLQALILATKFNNDSIVKVLLEVPDIKNDIRINEALWAACIYDSNACAVLLLAEPLVDSRFAQNRAQRLAEKH